jgi:hypothetical protein
LHRKQPKDWVSLREPYDIEVKYFKANEETEGEIRVFLNGVETCRFQNDKYQKGRVGFRWSNTKFQIKSLEVVGAPDEEWALEALQAKKEKEGKGEGGFGF